MIRSGITWGLAHGTTRYFLTSAARRGDLIARLAISPELRADPFAAYEELRTRGRLVHGRLAAATVDHALANQVLRSDAFTVAGGHEELPPPLRRLWNWAVDERALGPVDPPSMLAVDPPQHARYRRPVARAFTARAVDGMEAKVRSVAERLADRLAARSEPVDVVEDFAAQLPLAVIAELLGVPANERDRLLHWGNQAAVSLDPGLGWREYRTSETAIRQLHDWFDVHLGRLRRDPGEDLLSHLVQVQEAEGLSDLEVRATGLLLLGAGFETTVNLIGNAVVLLDRYPDQRALVLADPGRWGRAVEEVLRYDAPVQLTLRQAKEDTTVDGVDVRAGTAVLTYLGGANRDPDVFADPQTFDVTRSDADRHLSFSAGVHFCVGASLARMEARIGLEVLYDRFPGLRVVGTPERRATRVLRGYESVPVSAAASARRW
ncbi:cytochrome P450 [Marmoricola sp. RAF53]|uniref:cytochrome P450 n=1 Tax=Marmoricola sp. RAF53 TaxID=3233059 RepID=UPI003F948170